MKGRWRRCSTLLLKILASLLNVAREDLAYISIQMRANNNSKTVDLLRVRRHGISGKDPTFLTHLV